MKKKILVTGASGLVGSRFVELYSGQYELLTPGYPKFDLTDKDLIKSFIQKEKPEIIINLAAYTNVGEAENQRGDKNGECWKINVEGVTNLASCINSQEIHLIHISTDYIFPGSSLDPGPYSETHSPEKESAKLTWYGFTKAEGERVARDILGQNFSILRLIYPVRAKYDLKPDYLRKPLSLFDQGKLYPLFDDQQISITFIDEVALVLEKIIEAKIYGIFHSSSSNTTSPFELVSYFIKKMRGDKSLIKRISLDEFLKTVDNPVRYPKFGGLQVEETQSKLGLKFRTWQEIADEIARQMTA